MHFKKKDTELKSLKTFYMLSPFAPKKKKASLYFIEKVVEINVT